MYYDQFKRPIFSDNDIIEIFYEKKLDVIDKLTAIDSDDIKKFNNLAEQRINTNYKLNININDFDKNLQNNWYIPQEYLNIDIYEFLVDQCPKQNYQRVVEEYAAFKERNLLNLLKWLKYFVDTARTNNIVWGVGRGSSVASYVLYLIGVHKIDSVKYNLDWQEFLR